MNGFSIQSAGQGPSLLMFHGWGMHSGLWHDHLDWLQQQFTVHCVDLPGHGINRDVLMSPDMTTLCESLLPLLPDGNLLGWSLGGLLAQKLILLAPERFSSLTLVASSPCFLKRENWAVGMDAAVFENFAESLNRDTAQTLDRFIALEVHGSDTMKVDLKRLRVMVRDAELPTRNALQAGIRLLQDTDMRQDLDRISLPVMLIGGSRDRLVSPASLEATQTLIRDSRLCLIPKAGHAPFIGHPNQFKIALQEFLETIQA